MPHGPLRRERSENTVLIATRPRDLDAYTMPPCAA